MKGNYAIKGKIRAKIRLADCVVQWMMLSGPLELL